MNNPSFLSSFFHPPLTALVVVVILVVVATQQGKPRRRKKQIDPREKELESAHDTRYSTRGSIYDNESNKTATSKYTCRLL